MADQSDVEDGRGIRIERIKIENYKGIESLELELPAPELRSGSDVFVLGSRNGVGKTSILEAIGLVLFSIYNLRDRAQLNWDKLSEDLPVHLGQLIRAGSENARIVAEGVVNGQPGKATVVLSREEQLFETNYDKSVFLAIRPRGFNAHQLVHAPRELAAILGVSSQPFFRPSAALFHSFRKLAEVDPSPTAVIGDSRGGLFEGETWKFQRDSFSFDLFKYSVRRILLARANLIEDLGGGDVEDDFEHLERWLNRFASVSLGKFKRGRERELSIQVQPSEDGHSFPLDGLSSGQKSIITLLFLVWRATHDRPGVILIDEPELHLNPEWHRAVMKELVRLQPDNQYIVATHSDDVFSFADEERQILLTEGESRG